MSQIIINFEAQYMNDKHWDAKDSEFLLPCDHNQLVHCNDVINKSWYPKLPQTPLFDQQFV